MQQSSWDGLTILEQRLVIAVEEESPLCSIGLPETNHQCDGSVESFPALDHGECSEVLRKWLDAGLIELVRHHAGGVVDPVDYGDAGDLIANYAEWPLRTSVCVGFSGLGMKHFT